MRGDTLAHRLVTDHAQQNASLGLGRGDGWAALCRFQGSERTSIPLSFPLPFFSTVLNELKPIISLIAASGSISSCIGVSLLIV